MTNQPIILFDGVCHLCAASVRFVIRHDRRARFRFASLQSAVGQRLAAQHGVREPGLDSMILLDEGRAWRKSRAVLRTCRLLDGAWPLLSLLRIVPAWLADPLYDFVGRHRYRWFGRMTHCWLPDAALLPRFLDLENSER